MVTVPLSDNAVSSTFCSNLMEWKPDKSEDLSSSSGETTLSVNTSYINKLI